MRKIEHDTGKPYLEFIGYFKEFYGKTGLYPTTIPESKETDAIDKVATRAPLV